jgi:hypothetical protein
MVSLLGRKYKKRKNNLSSSKKSIIIIDPSILKKFIIHVLLKRSLS